MKPTELNQSGRLAQRYLDTIASVSKIPPHLAGSKRHDNATGKLALSESQLLDHLLQRREAAAPAAPTPEVVTSPVVQPAGLQKRTRSAAPKNAASKAAEPVVAAPVEPIAAAKPRRRKA